MTDERALLALAESFEASRAHLRGVAHRMLGSASEAEDAVQETWLRVSRAGASDVENLRGWLTTVTARICLDHLRAREARASNEDARGLAPEVDAPSPARDAEAEAVAAESLSVALLAVLEKLEPAERIAFVLHDLFGVAFDEIARIVERSPEAARQLASRGRRRVRGSPDRDEAALARQAATVGALLAALRAGDVEAVVAALDPEVVVHAEAPDGRLRVIRGARTWARSAVGYARAAGLADVELALVDGAVGAIYAPRGKLSRALRFAFGGDGRITRVDIVGDGTRLEAMEIAVLA